MSVLKIKGADGKFHSVLTIQGADGKSAYEVAVEQGFVGTEAEWLTSLHGADGLTPYVGENNNWWIGDEDTGILARGYTPVKGVDYFTEEEVQQIQNEVSGGAIGDFKAVVDSETNKFDANADSKFSYYNANAETKFSEYTSNAEAKLSEYNQNDSDKTTLYNSNAESKLSAYDSNAQAKLDLYNQNDSEKTEAYNSNAQTKLDAYNENADNRVTEFNAQTEQIQTDISGLKSDLGYYEIPIEFELGHINGSGVLVSATNIIRMTVYAKTDSLTDNLTIDDGCSYVCIVYDEDFSCTYSSGWYTTEITKDFIKSKGKYFKVALKYNTDENITDIDALASKMHIPVKQEHSYSVIDDVEKNKNDVIEINERLDKVISTTTVGEIEAEYEVGFIDGNGINTTNTSRIRTINYYDTSKIVSISVDNDYTYVLKLYNDADVCVHSSRSWLTDETFVSDLLVAYPTATKIRWCVKESIDKTVVSINTLASHIHVLGEIIVAGEIDKIKKEVDEINKPYVAKSNTGNFTIQCAKNHVTTDGNPPVVECFLIEDARTNKFYIARDLTSERKYVFTFSDSYMYSFGFMQNGDIIAVKDADALSGEFDVGETKHDNYRENPFVFLASENWSEKHEVDFGTSLKPSGWLSSCGFHSLPDGSALFCEYTRQSTATANVWKLSGDLTNPTNWNCVKTFTIMATPDDINFGLKHCHAIQYDFYTGKTYLCTGDDNIGSMVWFSADNGNTWTQLDVNGTGVVNQYGYYDGSEKYCRMLTMTFTEDYIYWASDTAVDISHYLFRASRDANGVLDYSTVQDYVHIPKVGNVATYGTCLIPELDAILLLERDDGTISEMPVRLVDLTDGTLKTIMTLKSISGGNVGFRTRYSEWYPIDGIVRLGFSLRMTNHSVAVNRIVGFGNVGNTQIGVGVNNINNLTLRVRKNNGVFKGMLNTNY